MGPGPPPLGPWGGSLGGGPGPMSAVQFSKHAHGCLGAWEGGPVVPGPPMAASPGSLGRLPGGPRGGGPGPMSSGQNVASPLGFGIIFYIDFDIDF